MQFQDEYTITVRPEHFNQARLIKNLMEQSGKYWSVCKNCPLSLALSEQSGHGEWFVTFDGLANYQDDFERTIASFKADEAGKFVINTFDNQENLDHNIVVTLIKTENYA